LILKVNSNKDSCQLPAASCQSQALLDAGNWQLATARTSAFLKSNHYTLARAVGAIAPIFEFSFKIKPL
jgi:hypothetical protein